MFLAGQGCVDSSRTLTEHRFADGQTGCCGNQTTALFMKHSNLPSPTASTELISYSVFFFSRIYFIDTFSSHCCELCETPPPHPTPVSDEWVNSLVSALQLFLLPTLFELAGWTTKTSAQSTLHYITVCLQP